MPYSHYPAARAVAGATTRYAPRAALVFGGFGAIVGGASAAARNIRRVREEGLDREDAIKDTIKEAAGAGLATAAATAVAGAIGVTGVLSLVGVFAVASGAKYLWDEASATSKAASPPPQETKAKKQAKASSTTN